MKRMIFRQLFDNQSSTYTYIIADPISKEAVIVDSVSEHFKRDVQLIKEMRLHLKYILETHIHADHITAASLLRDHFHAQIALSKTSGVECADLLLEDGKELRIGELCITVMTTPGHTDTCASYYVKDRVLTGDTLLIRGCGRTDFQQGSAARLFHSVREKLFQLPDETLVFPGHDYHGRTCSSIAEEKEHNPRLKLSHSLEDFEKVMNTLNLANPKLIDVAVPLNLKCGKVSE